MDQQNNKSFMNNVEMFLRRKWLFIAPLAAGTAIGLTLSYKLPQYYSSTSLVLLEEQQVPAEYVQPPEKTPFSHRLNVLSQSILSRAKLEQIITETMPDYDIEAGIFSRAFAGLKRIFNPDSAPQSGIDAIIEDMRENIRFEVIGEEFSRKGGHTGGNTFTISYSGKDPKTSQKVTSKLASLFIDENLKTRERFAEGTTEFLSGELEKAKGNLELQEGMIKEFKQARMGSLPEQLETNLKTLDRLQIDLQNITSSIKNGEDRKLFLQEQLNSPGKGAANPLALELDRLKNELAMLQSTFKPSYPDVIFTKKRIAELENQLAESKNSAKDETLAEARNPAVYAELVNVKSQIATLRQKEAEVRRQIRELERRVDVTPTNEQAQSDLMRDYKISLQNYQALLEKKMHAELSESLEKLQKGEKFRIIDPASLPAYPDKPNKPKVTALGAAAGGGIGVGLVFLIEFLNPAFRKPEDFEGLVSAPVLTSIPVFEEKKRTEPKLRVIKGRKTIG